jgi:hypothetical protein
MRRRGDCKPAMLRPLPYLRGGSRKIPGRILDATGRKLYTRTLGLCSADSRPRPIVLRPLSIQSRLRPPGATPSKSSPLSHGRQAKHAAFPTIGRQLEVPFLVLGHHAASPFIDIVPPTGQIMARPAKSIVAPSRPHEQVLNRPSPMFLFPAVANILDRLCRAFRNELYAAFAPSFFWPIDTRCRNPETRPLNSR